MPTRADRIEQSAGRKDQESVNERAGQPVHHVEVSVEKSSMKGR